MAQETKNKDYTLSSVKNALLILRAFSMDKSEMKITEIAKELGMGKSTVSRIMSTLASEGFVEKNPETNQYRLGLTILSLASVCTSTFEIHKEAMPVLHDLSEKTGETSHLAILDEFDVIYLHKVESKHRVRAFTHIGKRNPTYCTSSGKILLAFNDELFLKETIERGLVPYTEQTITDEEHLRLDLQKVYQNGYAISKEELSDGVITVAAPIRDFTGRVIASVNIIGPKQRMTDHSLSTHIKKVVSAGKDISQRLGYMGSR
ncbi:IclR family transcriptional regulator [Salibacterium salarium]|uniref:Glycerol operon regulatory protein n=1 Tax=Salibacterium salarium TaxID=284579 RepID=A0A3R9P3J7_9BACI|nr:IclR family transcriptional regulator [Salibacterium salarium]RSL29473.1 IclR family transcriptional regulator [Salibacterium salarium]